MKLNHLYSFVIALVFAFACSEDPEKLNDDNAIALGTMLTDAETLNGVHPNFNSKVGAPIAFDVATRWMDRYRTAQADDIDEGMAVISHFFGREAFVRILNQQGCVGISISYGINDDGKPVLIMVGIDADGKVMSKHETASFQDDSAPCPPMCPE